MSDSSTSIAPRWAESVAFASRLFDELDAATRTPAGIERRTYGEGEQRAHDLAARAAAELDLETATDAAGNLYLTYPGRDRTAPGWVTGSHLDSVPAGGNFDGAAGVVAGLAALHAFRTAGARPACDVTVMATRAEEGSSWFEGPHKSHFGSRAALGQIAEPEMRAARQVDDGTSLYDCIAAAGFDPAAIVSQPPYVTPERVRGFIEVHIEQGPVLVEQAVPVGLVTGIRGTLRARNARAVGAYAHSGAVPRQYRKDALFAAVGLAARVEDRWSQWLRDGRDAVCTFGRFHTDPEQHGLTKVPGEVRFTVDIRSQDRELLEEAALFLQELAVDISSERGVGIDLGALSLNAPALMSPALVGDLRQAATALSIPAIDIASGGGHDAANFVAAGIPTAMIFVRNENGSHNPDEAMNIDDFGLAARLLVEILLGGGQAAVS